MEDYNFDQKIEELESYVEDLKIAISRFVNARINSQSTAARKILQSIKMLSQELRLEIQNLKNFRKTK